MADQTNPTSGQTIDLRDQGKAGTPVTGGTTGQTARTPADQSLFDKFDIPEAVRQQYSELIPMILQTESMNDDERQYWFQILPIMTEEQVGKLREILDNEKQQLTKLDNEYENELKKINDKHVSEWKEFEAKEKRKKIQAAESQAKKTESATEEDLLNKLQNL